MNSIELAKKFVPIVDEIYKVQSCTQVIDSESMDFTGAGEVKVLKVSTTGLGDYSRDKGYPKGDVSASWETLKLTEERGKEISVDRMDDEETLFKTFGSVVGSFMREHVTPEVDAYRFAKYAGTDGVGKTDAGALTKDTIIEAIDEAVAYMDGKEVPTVSRVLFVNSNAKKPLSQALNRQWGSDDKVNTTLSGYNDMPIVYVPSARFYSALDMKDGVSEWGFAKASSGKAINFMIAEKSAVLQVAKFALPKIFDPDINQEKDAWKFQYRLYHDAFVYDNKKAGIFVNLDV